MLFTNVVNIKQMGSYGVFIVFVSVICIYVHLGFKVEQLENCSSIFLGF